MMIVNLTLINNREVFGIRSSIPKNSNAELKKQMVIMTMFLHSDFRNKSMLYLLPRLIFALFGQS